MQTITALYDDRQQALSAVHALRDNGIDEAEISVVANNVAGDPVADQAGEGAEVGAMTGGGVGFLASVGAFAIPGIGPVMAGGWLLATVGGAAVGALVGGLIGALANAGVPELDAHVYAEGVRRGGTLVAVRVDEDRAGTIAAILRNAGGVDIAARRTDYLAEGWQGFDEDAPVFSDEQIRNSRALYRPDEKSQ